MTIGQFLLTAPFDDGGGQDVGAEATGSALAETIGDVTDAGTAPDQVLQRRLVGHGTGRRQGRRGRRGFDVGRRQVDGRRRSAFSERFGGFEQLDGRHAVTGRRRFRVLQQFALEIADGGAFDQRRNEGQRRQLRQLRQRRQVLAFTLFHFGRIVDARSERHV